MAADKNYRSYADTEDVVIIGESISPPDESYSDTLKLSHVNRAAIYDTTIFGSQEDAIDIMRYSQLIHLKNCRLYGAGKYVVTIKGGCDLVALENVIIEQHGKTVDIDLGNFTPITKARTTNVVLRNVTSSDGKPVRVRVLNADKPTVEGGNVKVIVYPKWVVKLVFMFLKIFN